MSASATPELFYPEMRFGGYSRVDGTVAFFTRVNAVSSADSVVLDVGCGRGAYADDPVPTRRALRVFRGRVKAVIGIDVDPGAASNPFIDEFRLIEGPQWPVLSNSVDIVVGDYVMEHVECPGEFLAEARRVLRAGGVLCLRTPNRWSYPALAARVIPNRFHARIAASVQETRHAEDVFPTFYRCNSTRALTSALSAAGFDAVVLGHEAEPAYLAFSRWAYALGVLYSRVVPSVLKANLFAFGRAI